ncbi:MAG: DUF4838 domain-containing protein [Ruminococcaceae bacterium]|nr:DUF4838 domain-containing protein [Oscillospiraceae bacterium]
MKKLISLALAEIMILSSFVSCTTEEGSNISKSITASSGAEGIAEWLTDRLDGDVPDSLVLGVGNDNEYGIDMTDFEDDGYIIKSVGADTVLIGKTAEGLDLAARKYANSVDLGQDIKDTVYHEGYRVEKFTLFGRDISDYTIVCTSKDYNENMSFAASELQRLIKQACGAELPLVVGETDASPVIRLEHSYKEELEIGGYEYFEKNGDLVISGAVREGCTNGVYRFLENECNWNWLIYGNSDLQETDHLVIETGLYKTEVPAFEWHIVSQNRSNHLFKTDKTIREPGYLNMTKGQQSYPIKHANHGLTSKKWAGWIPNNHSGQLCYSTEAFYDVTVANILTYLEEQEAKGEIVGETIRDIDIAQGDSGTYCQCERCMEMMAEEKSLLGGVIRFANYVSESVNAEYPGHEMLFKVFAYYGALEVPAVTLPNEWVSVSYAPNGSCANHHMDGLQCDPDTNTFLDESGCEFGQFLADWCAVSDNTYVWYYHIGDSFNYYSVWDLIYYDYKYMHDLGVKGVYFYNYARGMGLKTVEHLLAWYLLWDIDMTWDEYEALFDRCLEEEYGDGWMHMKELLAMYSEAENDLCWNCWGYADRVSGIDMYDMAYIAENYEIMASLIEKVITLATNPYQEALGEMFSLSIYYCGCYANFFRYLNDGNEAGIAQLEAEYQLIIDRFAENGYTHTYIPNLSHFSIGDTIWEEAATEWSEVRHRLPSGTSEEVSYTKGDFMVKEINALGDITSYDEAVELIKLIEDYNALSDADKSKVTNIGKATALVQDAAEFFTDDSLTLKVMSFNVYYSNLTAARLAGIAKIIKSEEPDVIGIQEGMLDTCNTIYDYLGENYEMVGIGRDNTDDSENCNIFYRTDKFELLDSGTIWLTRTPHKWSIHSGAGLPRIATYAKLKRISDGQIFVYANTHYDLASDTVRKAESVFLTKFLKEEFGTAYPTVITGDFNCTEGTPGITTLNDEGFRATNKYGTIAPTFQAWGKDGKYIDFTFVNDLFPVRSYKVGDATLDGEYMSDHNPLISELVLLPTYKSLKGK